MFPYLAVIGGLLGAMNKQSGHAKDEEKKRKAAELMPYAARALQAGANPAAVGMISDTAGQDHSAPSFLGDLAGSIAPSVGKWIDQSGDDDEEEKRRLMREGTQAGPSSGVSMKYSDFF